MNKARGAALLILLSLLLLISAGVMLARLHPGGEWRHREETLRQMQEAKAALLAYAVTYEDHYADPLSPNFPPPGYLPCPNQDLPEENESPNPPCHMRAPILGRLPRTFPAGTAGVHETFTTGTRTGEEFWYVLSKGFQNNHYPKVLNPTSPALLTVDGQGGIVAVIIAPGPPLAGQRRPSTHPKDYLEGENADGDNDFATGAPSNDQLLFITRAEHATRISERVAADLKQVLDSVFDGEGRYPTELPAGTLPPWFAVNWAAVTTYSPSGAGATLRFAGCRIRYHLVRAAPAPMKEGGSC